MLYGIMQTHEYHLFQKGEHGLALATAPYANGRLAMADPHVAKWFELSVEWLRSQFGELILEDKPFEFVFDQK